MNCEQLGRIYGSQAQRTAVRTKVEDRHNDVLKSMYLYRLQIKNYMNEVILMCCYLTYNDYTFVRHS